MALWNGRFGSDPSAAVANYTESISYDKRLYRWDIAGSKAHVAMLGAQNIIPSSTAEAIATELDVIQKRIEQGDFEFKTELEDIHMHIESALIDKLGAEGARVHSARSRNDQIALDIRLYLRDEAQVLISMIRDFQKTLLGVAKENARTIMPGFTHLQHAQVVLLAHHLLAYVEMFDRDAARISDCAKRFNVLPLGSGAIAGSTLPIDRQNVANALGFDSVSRNSMDSVADRDFAIELLSALAIFTMHTSRLSEDLILWCSQEFDFIELDDAFCTGSSLMPQKKNPDVCELTRGKTARVYGDLIQLLTLCKGLPLTYNRDMQEDKESIFDALDTVKMILRVYPPMIASMKVKVDSMRRWALDPALMATDLAEQLVKQGVPFRTAHHQVGALVKFTRDHHKALNEVTLDEMKLSIPDATEEFLTLFNPEASVAKRESVGGTGYKSVQDQLAYWEKSLN